jgi:hypothetical protein
MAVMTYVMSVVPLSMYMSQEAKPLIYSKLSPGTIVGLTPVLTVEYAHESSSGRKQQCTHKEVLTEDVQD